MREPSTTASIPTTGSARGRKAESDPLRRQAEALAARTPPPVVIPADPLRAAHELEVYQIELELQNAALEEARAEAEVGRRRYQDLYDLAPVGYFSLDRVGLILQANFAGAGLLGIPRAELGQRRFADFLRPDDRRRFADLLANPTGRIEVHLPGPEGRGLWVRLEIGGVLEGDSLRLMAVDFSELHAVSEEVHRLNRDLELRVEQRAAELLAANTDLSAFCYMISHELRAPVARLEGFSRMLQAGPPGPDPGWLPHLAGRIEVASQRMRQVIDSLLTLTRLSLDPVQCQRVDLSQLVRETLADLEHEGWPRPAVVRVQDRVQAWGDRRLLAIALRNLLENALKFSSGQPKAKVEFGVVSQEGSPVLFVRDHGAGFEQGETDKLFQPFVRFHRQEEYPGTGIGLSIARKVIEKHHGRIWAESAPGRGATFYFTLGMKEHS
jgi:signal transduction histidine kinase